MKISELNTNTFLNGDGVPENSYLLINYTASQGAAPSTQKVSLDTLGKAVAANLNLPIAVTDNSGNVTGLQHVSASGNQYHIENLNASFGGGGSGGGSSSVSFDPTAPKYVYNGSDSSVRLAYPLYVYSTASADDTTKPVDLMAGKAYVGPLRTESMTDSGYIGDIKEIYYPGFYISSMSLES